MMWWRTFLVDTLLISNTVVEVVNSTKLHFLWRMIRTHLPRPSSLAASLCVVEPAELLEVCEESGVANRENHWDFPPAHCTKVCLSRARIIISGLFSLLTSKKRFYSIRCRTTRFCNSFFPHATRLLNTNWMLPWKWSPCSVFNLPLPLTECIYYTACKYLHNVYI